jgi:hypothetical protein
VIFRTRRTLPLDFYDRGRVASWVRDHAGMVLWVTCGRSASADCVVPHLKVKIGLQENELPIRILRINR